MYVNKCTYIFIVSHIYIKRDGKFKNDTLLVPNIFFTYFTCVSQISDCFIRNLVVGPILLYDNEYGTVEGGWKCIGLGLF